MKTLSTYASMSLRTIPAGLPFTVKHDLELIVDPVTPNSQRRFDSAVFRSLTHLQSRVVKHRIKFRFDNSQIR